MSSQTWDAFQHECQHHHAINTCPTGMPIATHTHTTHPAPEHQAARVVKVRQHARLLQQLPLHRVHGVP